jgi:hypothetical protein
LGVTWGGLVGDRGHGRKGQLRVAAPSRSTPTNPAACGVWGRWRSSAPKPTALAS